MRKIHLDIRNIHTVKALHVYLQYMLDLPAYYGRNLDALYDLLCQESERVCIEIQYNPDADCETAAYFPKLVRVMEDAAQDNDRLSVVFCRE